jgi:hypothetical protein
METSLHRQLKQLYAQAGSQLEARVGPYRIDVASGGQLVEIQHGALAALRDKLRALLVEHDVLVVKPIVANKTLVKRSSRRGKVIERRRSPKRGTLLSAFDELVYFTKVFPHPRLTLELLLVDVEEWRYPGHGRRRRWRQNDHVVEDRKLLAVGQSVRLRTAGDLARLLPCPLPHEFHTADLAALWGVARWTAQRVAYCLRECGAIEAIGKRGNAHVYRPCTTVRARRRAG